MIRASMLLLLLLHAASCAAADAYPSKAVRWLIPAQAGGANDTAARLIAPRLAEALGQPVVVDNRGGAGGNIGMELAARAVPDGYTISQVSTIQAMNASFYSGLKYDLLRDFTPVTEMISLVTVMAVHPSLPVQNGGDLIAYAKANPGRLNFVSGTNGATGHYLKFLAGIDMTVVLYKGTPPAVTETIGGQGHVIITTASGVMPFVRQGKLRAIAVTSSTRRSPLFPELPPLADAVPGFENPIWYGVVAPARTPVAIVRRLHAEFARVMQAPEFQQRVNGMGAEVSAGSTEQFGKRMRDEVDKWPKVVEAMGGPVN